MTKSRNEDFDLNAYRHAASSAVVEQIFILAYEDSKKHGQEFADLVTTTILKDIIATLVFRSLRPPTPPNKRSGLPAREAQVRAQYSTIKQEITGAVANGFAGGFKAFDPVSDPDFYCTVAPVPDPINILPA